jgi:succinate dehydrogenase (ubiquinone) cytochrome b560 subunit
MHTCQALDIRANNISHKTPAAATRTAPPLSFVPSSENALPTLPPIAVPEPRESEHPARSLPDRAPAHRTTVSRFGLNPAREAARLTPGRRASTTQPRAAAPAAPGSGSAETILEQQRLVRPVSPHLSIYKPQITWLASGAHRLTGVVLSGGLYLWSIAYLIGPTIGFQAGSTTLAAAFAAWPFVLKAAAKVTLAFPFAFHCFNGLRHIAWDFGLGFAKARVIQTGWLVVGLSTVSSLYLALAW